MSTMPSRPPAKSAAAKKAAVNKAKLPASNRAILNAAREMIEQMDKERGQIFVQQATNSHTEDDIYMMGPEGDVTYKERLAKLDEHEQSLYNQLPPAVMQTLESEREAEEGAPS